MKKCLSVLLVFVMLLGLAAISATAESVDLAESGVSVELSDTGANADLAETGAESWLWPVPANRTVTSGRGYSSGHKGIDIPGNTSYDIVAAKSGTVLYVFSGCNNCGAASANGKSCSTETCSYSHPAKCTLVTNGKTITRYVCNYGFGRGVVIKNSDGSYAGYAHMSKVNVKVGNTVKQGQILGKMGNYGFSAGNHLHFCASKSGSSWGAYDQNVNPDSGIKYIYSTVQSQDLGAKFYANIVTTDKNSLAVTGTDKDNVQLGNLNYSDYQKWLFERQSDKSYKITNVKRNKCLDVDNYGTKDGTNIQLWKSNNSTAQRWFIVKNGSGYSFLPKFNQGSAMDVSGAKFANGTNIHEWYCKQNSAQRFSVIKTVNYKDLGAKFNAKINSSQSGFSVAVNSKANVYLEKSANNTYQKWKFERQADMTYRITNIKTGKCLDVSGAKTANGTNVQVWKSNNSNAQKWYLVPNGKYFSLVPKCNLKAALDVSGAKFVKGTNIQEWQQNTSNAQKFSISKY